MFHDCAAATVLSEVPDKVCFPVEVCVVCLEKGRCLFIVFLSFCMQNPMSRSLLKTQDFVKALAAFGKSVKDPQVLIRKDPKRKIYM